MLQFGGKSVCCRCVDQARTAWNRLVLTRCNNGTGANGSVGLRVLQHIQDHNNRGEGFTFTLGLIQNWWCRGKAIFFPDNPLNRPQQTCLSPLS